MVAFSTSCGFCGKTIEFTLLVSSFSPRMSTPKIMTTTRKYFLYQCVGRKSMLHFDTWCGRNVNGVFVYAMAKSRTCSQLRSKSVWVPAISRRLSRPIRKNAFKHLDTPRIRSVYRSHRRMLWNLTRFPRFLYARESSFSRSNVKLPLGAAWPFFLIYDVTRAQAPREVNSRGKAMKANEVCRASLEAIVRKE